MEKILLLIVIGTTTAFVAPAWSQDASKASPIRVLTKTLVASEAHKECLSLTNKQWLNYKFRADGPLHFKLSHQEEKEVVDIKRDGTYSASGTFTPRKSADHCLVWTNVGKQPVTLRYQFQRGSQ